MSPYKEYRGDKQVDLEWDDDDEEVTCSCDDCNNPGERNGYCPECNEEIHKFIVFFRGLSNKVRKEIEFNAFNPETWDLNSDLD